MNENNTVLIKNGHIIDPANNMDSVLDLLIENGKIARISEKIDKNDAEVIDAAGKYVLPGFIDMHVHLRSPGREDEETIVTGSRAAARGGFTSILCMPNTEPPIDNEGLVEFIYKQAAKDASVNVFCAGCITKGRKGKELVEMAKLKQAGAVALTDDGSPVTNSHLMRRALEYSSMVGLRIISHCEDLELSSDGQMHEGYFSTALGLKGIPAQAEEIAICRDISLSKLTGVPVHIAHVSTEGAVDIIRNAKSGGIPVTCETAPHYFTLTDECLKTYDTNFKVNPPIRGEEDVRAIKEGVKDGTIDVIATDHAPHADFEKEMEFDYAPSGIIGLETAVNLSLNAFDIRTILPKFTINPAQILGLPKGTLSIGACADVTIVDLDKKITVDASGFLSKSRNTPFDKWQLDGCVVMTIVGGKVVYNEL